MLFFSKKYQNTKFIILTENYRSTQNILDLSSKSISTNKSRISNYIQEVQKDLKSNLKLDILPRFFALKNDLEEKILVLENIIDLQKKNPDLRQEDFAIIVRTNKEVQEWTDFLQNN
jgi:DNA helicase II / ATP-dependent DNA helicase PcrA